MSDFKVQSCEGNQWEVKPVSKELEEADQDEHSDQESKPASPKETD